MIQQMKKMIDPLRKRVMTLAARAIIKLVNDATAIQKIQATVLNNEVRENNERFQEYGFTSVPISGAEGVILRMGSNSDHGIIIATEDRRYRLRNLESGEVAIYTDEGDYIKLGRDNHITIQTTTLTVNGNMEVTGDILDNAGSNSNNIAAMRSIFNLHKHGGGPVPDTTM